MGICTPFGVRWVIGGELSTNVMVEVFFALGRPKCSKLAAEKLQRKWGSPG